MPATSGRPKSHQASSGNEGGSPRTIGYTSNWGGCLSQGMYACVLRGSPQSRRTLQLPDTGWPTPSIFSDEILRATTLPAGLAQRLPHGRPRWRADRRSIELVGMADGDERLLRSLNGSKPRPVREMSVITAPTRLSRGCRCREPAGSGIAVAGPRYHRHQARG
jgi:hypothetical protein